MEQPRVYLDENVHGAVASGLRWRGYDVVTTIDAGRSGTSDDDQLRFAAAERRVLVTFDRGDFARLHAEYLASGRSHAGIVVSRQGAAGPVVRALAELLGGRDASELENAIFWLALSTS